MNKKPKRSDIKMGRVAAEKDCAMQAVATEVEKYNEDVFSHGENKASEAEKEEN